MDNLDVALSDWFRAEFVWHKHRPPLGENLTPPQQKLKDNADRQRARVIHLFEQTAACCGS